MVDVKKNQKETLTIISTWDKPAVFAVQKGLLHKAISKPFYALLTFFKCYDTGCPRKHFLWANPIYYVQVGWIPYVTDFEK